MAFKLKPQRKETENKTIRFPVQLIEEIEKAIEGNEASFSHFVIEACKFALENMEEDVHENEENI